MEEKRITHAHKIAMGKRPGKKYLKRKRDVNI
jgi:hypothetical protein